MIYEKTKQEILNLSKQLWDIGLKQGLPEITDLGWKVHHLTSNMIDLYYAEGEEESSTGTTSEKLQKAFEAKE